MPGSKVFFTSGGSDSIDTAAKLARRYWVEAGQPERTVVIGRQKAYHGMHYAGTALAGIPGNREGYGELVPDAATVAWDIASTTCARRSSGSGPSDVAAFFCEPVIGAGGVYPPPEGYLAGVRKVCTEYDVLFVADEVVTGYGRIGGAWFACVEVRARARHGHLGEGADVGLCCRWARCSSHRGCAEPFFRPDAGRVVAARLHVLGSRGVPLRSRWPTSTIIEREGLLDEAARLETTLADRLSPLADHRGRRRGSVRDGRVGGGPAGRPADGDGAWPSGCARTASRRGRSEPAASRSRRRSS